MTNHTAEQLAKPKVVVYSLDKESFACPVLRILTPLRLAGWNVLWGVSHGNSGLAYNPELARTADLVIIQRHFPGEFTYDALRSITRQNTPIIYDLDDAFLDADVTHPKFQGPMPDPMEPHSAGRASNRPARD